MKRPFNHAPTYKTFKRSAKSWSQFVSARKIVVDTGLTYEQAREACREFNSNLTAKQKSKGTKLEFIEE